MNSSKLGFTFAGGFKDGCVVRGDSTKGSERSKVESFATVTHGSAIGKKFRGRSKEANEHIHEKLAEGEPVEEARQYTYKVVSHTTEDNGFVMVACEFVSADEA